MRLKAYPSGSVRSRALWGALDQGLASASNVGLGVVVARSVTLREFGAFSTVYLTYVLLGLLSRSSCSEVLVVRYSAAPTVEQRRAVRASVGFALDSALVVGACCAAVALVLGGDLRPGLLALAACLPGLFVQDAWRYSFFAERRPAAATVNDLVWAVVQFAGLGLIATIGDVSVVSAILVWGVAAYVAAAAGCVQTRRLPGATDAVWWWRSHRDLVPRFMAEYVLMRGSSQLTLFIVAAVTSLAAFGALRAGNLLLGPLNVLFASAAIVAIPEGVRLRDESPSRLWKLCWLAAGAMGVIAAGLGVALLVMPESFGVWLLGSTWASARRLVVPLTVATVGMAVQVAAFIGLRATSLVHHSLRARLAMAPARVVAGTGGALLGGAHGAAWGLAVGEAFGAAVHWRQLAAGFSTGVPDVSTAPAVTPRGADILGSEPAPEDPMPATGLGGAGVVSP